jgi:hypothetical protein
MVVLEASHVSEIHGPAYEPQDTKWNFLGLLSPNPLSVTKPERTEAIQRKRNLCRVQASAATLTLGTEILDIANFADYSIRVYKY